MKIISPGALLVRADKRTGKKLIVAASDFSNEH
jgi:hypothetical protein